MSSKMSLFLFLFLNIYANHATRDWLPSDVHSMNYLNISIEYDLSAPTSCTHSRDCSYNGKCMNDECVCNPQWMGPHCAVLHLLPTNKEYGYQYVLNDQHVSSWGGPVVRDDDGDYHMFAA
eukprot:332899_1